MATTTRLVLLVLAVHCNILYGFVNPMYLRGEFNLNVAMEEVDDESDVIPDFNSAMDSAAAGETDGDLVADNILDDHSPLDVSALVHHAAEHMEWWHILLIALAIIIGIAIVVLGVIRCCRHKAHFRDKMEEFLDKYRQYALIRDGNTSNYEDLVIDSDPELMGRRITL